MELPQISLRILHKDLRLFAALTIFTSTQDEYLHPVINQGVVVVSRMKTFGSSFPTKLTRIFSEFLLEPVPFLLSIIIFFT